MCDEIIKECDEYILFSNDNKDKGGFSELIKTLKENKLKVCTAESCTGGGIAKKLTSVSESSEYFVGGVVTYATETKYQLLNVNPETVEKYNVVSAEVAAEMAKGALDLFDDADMSISITGLAGPDDNGGIKAGTAYASICFRHEKPDVIKIETKSNDRTSNIEKFISEVIG